MATVRAQHQGAAPAQPVDRDTLAAQMAGQAQALAPARAYLDALSAWLDHGYLRGTSAAQLIAKRAEGIDILLQVLWEKFGLESFDGLGLLAVGGYGRAELHPQSDIDLLVLADTESTATGANEPIGQFITALWDTGLQVGHSVRSLEHCVDLGRQDLSVVTNLTEARLLAGAVRLRDELRAAIDPRQMWSSGEFFRAKREEQLARHRRYAHSEYNLEPNLKSCPGGLRDIQMIGWVAKRHFATRTIRELVDQGFLSLAEYDALIEGQNFLWRLRYGLHMLAGRAEDRLLFDYQRQLAELFGFEDDENGIAIEYFMKAYYRWALKLGTLNEMLMQLLDESILRASEAEELVGINRRFRIRNGYIETCNDHVFRDTPYALMEVFVLLAQHPNIDGIRASTIRLIQQDCAQIDEKFRASSRNNQLFLKLLCSTHKIATQLRRMHRYGVLGRFVPEFGGIIGMMQHDLFHIYTVDAHTLQVVKNLRRFLYPEERELFPIAAQILHRLPRPELLYIAGLFHDLGKGRGGDHSKLGAVDAQAFCQRLALSQREARLVAWLVEHHLVMSTTSQRKDLSDPGVIRQFAQLVGDRLHLDYLYALTVADINATNPALWNSWRASLLGTLYGETRLALRRGLEATVDKSELIEENRVRARRRLMRSGFDQARIEALWHHLGDDYFARETFTDIVWQCEAILKYQAEEETVVLIREVGTRLEGVTQIFLYTLDRPQLFATIAASLERLGLDVHGARLYTSVDKHVLDSFFVLESNGRPVGDDPLRVDEIRVALHSALSGRLRDPPDNARRMPRRLKHFLAATRTALRRDPATGCSVLELSTTDRPGLLASIGRVFVRFGIQVHDARISTLGERVEDVFFITNRDGKKVHDDELGTLLQGALQAELDSELQASRS